nr:glycosyltransferase family 87 protein [Halovenus rubra]
MLASDVYYYAADALLSGGDIYNVAPPDRSGYHYIYPPVIIFVFVPHVFLGGPGAAFAVQTVLNTGFAVGIAVFLWRALSRRNVALTWIDWLLLTGFGLFSSYSAITVVNGQVTLWLGFAVAAGLDALDRDRDAVAGIAFAGAALVKVFPAVLGLWLLRRRSYRAVVAAVVFGFAGILVGIFALGPDVTETYFTEVLTGRYDGFDGAPEPAATRGGAQRQVAAIFGIGPPYVTPLAAVVLGPILGYLYLDVGTDNKKNATVLGTVLVALLFFPLQRLYMVLFIVPLVVLLYRLPSGRPRQLLVVGTLVSTVRVSFPVVETAVRGLGVAGPLESALLAVGHRFYEVILFPTLGMWLLLLGCVFVHVDL